MDLGWWCLYSVFCSVFASQDMEMLSKGWQVGLFYDREEEGDKLAFVDNICISYFNKKKYDIFMKVNWVFFF